ncbi:MAG: single-stranded-DNA-specific exonuclease RecJ [Evtepia sp.]|uniref:single-stranded-DNA-specific exonuclease RecJ n=1 Tax=Evtepia sp. TaxID=2773933 RepID=UPI002A74B63D|nr:single-stranded-DNA-specific exonuclease RecJ [Evtepia sp.]MDY3014290.1 single-stranded-DNA-specific exonuclease RecJ [Evtepia sp.]
MKYQQWNITHRPEEAYKAMRKQGIPTLVASTLCAREITCLDEARMLLSSGEDQLQDPFLMKDMDLAVARIGRALRNGEKIAVYGDYDVDGITSTCLLTHYLRSQGGEVIYYIPNRLEEGYGVNNQALDQLAQEGVKLIITVDCGITAVEEVRYAAGLGLDMIITDHHECKEELPAALAVVDPRRKDCPYPFKELAGVGVALKLVMALGGPARYRALFHEYADLTAVGTVADVMQLLGENRTIVRVGLNHLKKTKRRGLYALMLEAGTLNRAITSTTVGYCLSPRINAAGRMGRAAMAAELILTEDTSRAELLAHELCELNRQRQAVELSIFNQCLDQLSGRKQYDCLVLADKTWHQGVVGIVASRLSEQFACPVFMICLQEDGKGKGSCRSYGGFNLFCALDQCSDLLEGYGGHMLAAGFSIKEENIPAFRERMQEIVRANTGGEEMVSTLQIDGEIENASILTVEEVEALSMLEPYGAGNPKPVFSLSGVTVTCLSDVGGGRHLKMRASRDGRTVDMIFFSVTRAQSGLSVGDKADVAFYPQINEYRGSRTVQLHLVDLRPSYSTKQLSEQELYRRFCRGERITPWEARSMIPRRDEFAAVWRYLARRNGEVADTPIRLARKVAHEEDLWESTLRTMICLDVLEQFGLVKIWQEENHIIRVRLQKRKERGKVALFQAPIIQRLQAIAWEEDGSMNRSSASS